MNLMMTWVNMGKYDKVLKMAPKRIRENPNNTDVHNYAVALYSVGKYEKSISYLQRELFVQEDETTYFMLGQNFFKLNEYENAIMAYRKSLSFINENNAKIVQYTDENGQELTSSVKGSWIDEKLLTIYPPLIESYYRIEEHLNAKAIWKIAVEKFPYKNEILYWGNVIDNALKAKNQINLVENQYFDVLKQLQKEKEENKRNCNTIREWAKKLMKIQLADEDAKLDDDSWGYFAEKIEEVIGFMSAEIQYENNNVSYKNIKDEYMNKFSRLDPKSIDFLATAEYLYLSNRDFTIDYAPIMVEFCKVLEYELRIILNNRKMLGENLTFIKFGNIKPLVSKHEILSKIHYYRNGSAHTGFSTREKVEKVRELLIDDGILKMICEIKK